MKHSIIAACMLAGIGGCVTGCTKSGQDAFVNANVASAPQESSSSFDLQANMTATVAALEAERAVLQRALQSWSSIGAEDRAAFWASMTEQRRLADELAVALKANPTWVESVCGWYDSTLRKPYGETVRLRNRLREQQTGSRDRSDFNLLLLDAAGSQMAAQEYVRCMIDNPGEPTNIHIMCLKFGHIDDDS